jgi:hypothetical protein
LLKALHELYCPLEGRRWFARVESGNWAVVDELGNVLATITTTGGPVTANVWSADLAAQIAALPQVAWWLEHIASPQPNICRLRAENDFVSTAGEMSAAILEQDNDQWWRGGLWAVVQRLRHPVAYVRRCRERHQFIVDGAVAQVETAQQIEASVVCGSCDPT